MTSSDSHRNYYGKFSKVPWYSADWNFLWQWNSEEVDIRAATKVTEVSREGEEIASQFEERYMQGWLVLNWNLTMPSWRLTLSPCWNHPPTHAHSEEGAKQSSSLPAGRMRVTSVLHKSLKSHSFQRCSNISSLPCTHKCVQPSHFTSILGSCSAPRAAMARIRDEWV